MADDKAPLGLSLGIKGDILGGKFALVGPVDKNIARISEWQNAAHTQSAIGAAAAAKSRAKKTKPSKKLSKAEAKKLKETIKKNKKLAKAQAIREQSHFDKTGEVDTCVFGLVCTSRRPDFFFFFFISCLYLQVWVPRYRQIVVCESRRASIKCGWQLVGYQSCKDRKRTDTSCILPPIMAHTTEEEVQKARESLAEIVSTVGGAPRPMLLFLIPTSETTSRDIGSKDINISQLEAGLTTTTKIKIK